MQSSIPASPLKIFQRFLVGQPSPPGGAAPNAPFPKALARVHARTGNPSGRQPSDGLDEALLAHATSITVDRAADQASWWFALHCQEEWAIEKLRPQIEIPALSRVEPQLGSLIRRSIAEVRLDPVAEIRRYEAQVNSRTLPAGFGDWVLGFGKLKEDDLRASVSHMIHLINHYGGGLQSISELLQAAAGMKVSQSTTAPSDSRTFNDSRTPAKS